MNVREIIRLLLGLQGGSGDRWKVSKDTGSGGVAIGPVKSFTTGTDGPRVRFHAEFTDNGKNHSLIGLYDFSNKDTITFDGKNVDGDDVVISSRVVFPNLIGIVEFKFQVGTGHVRYRFDGRLGSLLDLVKL